MAQHMKVSFLNVKCYAKFVFGTMCCVIIYEHLHLTDVGNK